MVLNLYFPFCNVTYFFPICMHVKHYVNINKSLIFQYIWMQISIAFSILVLLKMDFCTGAHVDWNLCSGTLWAKHLCTGPLWDWNITWHTDKPDFTPCFHKVKIKILGRLLSKKCCSWLVVITKPKQSYLVRKII